MRSYRYQGKAFIVHPIAVSETDSAILQGVIEQPGFEQKAAPKRRVAPPSHFIGSMQGPIGGLAPRSRAFNKDRCGSRRPGETLGDHYPRRLRAEFAVEVLVRAHTAQRSTRSAAASRGCRAALRYGGKPWSRLHTRQREPSTRSGAASRPARQAPRQGVSGDLPQEPQQQAATHAQHDPRPDLERRQHREGGVGGEPQEQQQETAQARGHDGGFIWRRIASHWRPSSFIYSRWRFHGGQKKWMLAVSRLLRTFESSARNQQI